MSITLSKRSSRIDTSAIRSVFDLAQTISNPLDLSIGQPDFPVPQKVKQAIQKAIQENKTSYTITKGILPLREKIASVYHLEYGCKYDPNNILISHGVANILFFLFQVLFNPNDVVILIEPYFLIYRSLAEYHQLQIEYLNENFSEQDIQELYKRIKNPKAILFSSPSNPTGYILQKEQIKLICEYARKNNTLVISDEIYKQYDYEGIFYSPANIFPENTIILNGFSKSHSMTGLRVGYILVHHSLSKIVDNIANLQQYSSVCSPTPMQWGALVALDTSVEFFVNVMKKRRNIVLSLLQGKTSFSYPSGAFYVFPEIPIDCNIFVKKAIANKLLVVPGSIFERGKNHIRISYAQDESILKKAMEVLLHLIVSDK